MANTVTTTKKMNYLKTFLPYLFGNKKGKSLEFSLPDPLPEPLSFEERLMFHAISHSLNPYVQSLNLNSLSEHDVFHLLNFLEFLNQDLQKSIEGKFSREFELLKTATKAHALSKKALQELLDFPVKKLTLFAILNSDRTKPGRIVIRDEHGSFFTKPNGSVWSIPILALSGRGLPFNHSNGCTPMGVFTIDSVMPEANKNYEFGEYRRLIVNFIKPSENEVELMKLLPRDQHGLAWWKQSLVGRVLGRSLLRIHGTGRVNRNFLTPYYPFVPTSGCLATNEASILGLKKARDQRLLLNALMQAQNLPISYENESKIHGLLYVVEFGDNLSALRF